MLSKEDYVLIQFLGKDTPEVKALIAAVAANHDLVSMVHEMLRSMARQRGWDLDDSPHFALPQKLRRSSRLRR